MSLPSFKIISKKVAVLAGCRAPVWFRRLSIAKQAQVPVRSAADQVPAIGYNPSNLPALTGPSYDGVRADYMDLTSVGKKWRNPAKIAKVKRADGNLGALAVTTASAQVEIEALARRLEIAQRETTEAKTAIEALMSKTNESIIASQMAAVETKAAFQEILNRGTPIQVPAPIAPAQSDEIAEIREQIKGQADVISQLVAALTSGTLVAQKAPKAARKTRRASSKRA